MEMNLNRLLDQPYLDLNNMNKPWVRNDFYGEYPPEDDEIDFLVEKTMESFLNSTEVISAFEYKGKWIDSNQSFLDLVHSPEINLLQIEELALYYLCHYKLESSDQETKEINFKDLNFWDKLGILNIFEYAKDRNVLTLWKMLLLRK